MNIMTRVGKILESLNKRTRKLKESHSQFKIVYLNNLEERGHDYYSWRQENDFKKDIKNLEKSYPYGAGAYEWDDNSNDWKFVAGEDLLAEK